MMSSSQPMSLHPVAAYVRMSTNHQQFSTKNQLDYIRLYAAEHDMEIIQIYEDSGKSGLSIQGRKEFQHMMDDIQSGQAKYTTVLVYDVSRWGRFQDADQSGYFEFICKKAGVTIKFCADQFDNDGSMPSTMIKNVKRLMAGEYSRELSTKVFRGACRLIEYGYRQGGIAGYGLRRMLIDAQGNFKGLLERGQQKSIQTDRVILVPGPNDEVATVRWIYDQFINYKKSESNIADELNARNISTSITKHFWTRSIVHEILTNEKYCGNNVYHRTSFKLKEKHVVNPPTMWVRKNGAFQSLIDDYTFSIAQRLIATRSLRLTDDEMLGRLRALWERRGELNGILIDESDDTPSSSAYRYRFGNLMRAYSLIGYISGIDYRFMEANRRLRVLHSTTMESVMDGIRATGSWVEHDKDNDLIHINGELSLSILICRCQHTARGAFRWVIKLEPALCPDLSVAVRMQPDNAVIRDYYVLPSLDIRDIRLRLAENNGIYLDAFRHETLAPLYEAMSRANLLLSYEN